MQKNLPFPVITSSSKVVIVGYGNFGRHLEQLLCSRAPQLRVDIHQPGPKHIGDGSFDISEYDIIVLAIPLRVYERAIKDIVPRMKEDAILVDVGTVKVHTMALLEKYANRRFWIATHPMWGPETYRKTGEDVRGYKLVVTGYSIPRRLFRQLRATVKSVGINVVEMAPDQHDSLLAYSLFVTHYFGQVISFAGLRRTAIDTISFGYLMDAAESVEKDTSLFLDVLRFNQALCSAVLARIEDAEHRVRLMMEGARK